MGIHIAIEHRTSYLFDRTTTIHPHIFRLRPAPHSRTPILAYSLERLAEGPLPQLAAGSVRQLLARLVFHEPADRLDITVDLVADMTVINPFDFFVEESAEKYPFFYDPQTARISTPTCDRRRVPASG